MALEEGVDGSRGVWTGERGEETVSSELSFGWRTFSRNEVTGGRGAGRYGRTAQGKGDREVSVGHESGAGGPESPLFSSHMKKGPFWKCPVAAQVGGEGEDIFKGRIFCGKARPSLNLLNFSYQRVQSH